MSGFKSKKELKEMPIKDASEWLAKCYHMYKKPDGKREYVISTLNGAVRGASYDELWSNLKKFVGIVE